MDAVISLVYSDFTDMDDISQIMIVSLFFSAINTEKQTRDTKIQNYKNNNIIYIFSPHTLAFASPQSPETNSTSRHPQNTSPSPSSVAEEPST